MPIKVWGSHKRREPIGFVPLVVEYEVEGTYYAPTRARFDDPGDPPEVELVTAIRIDPLTGERTNMRFDRWCFSNEEEQSIQSMFFRLMEEDNYG